ACSSAWAREPASQTLARQQLRANVCEAGSLAHAELQTCSVVLHLDLELLALPFRNDARSQRHACDARLRLDAMLDRVLDQRDQQEWRERRIAQLERQTNIHLQPLTETQLHEL